MKTILLTSAGMQVKNEILKILPRSPNRIKVGHIITASKPELDTSYVKKDKHAMSALGFTVENIDIENKNEKELRNLLNDKDVIYVQGGNTFYLLKWMKDSGFDIVLKELIEKGKIYIGVSAGSVIMGENIKTAGWKGIDKNIVGLTDLTGLQYVPFSIFVHYKPVHNKVIKENIPHINNKIKILTDQQAFLIQDDMISLVGTGEEIKIEDIMKG